MTRSSPLRSQNTMIYNNYAESLGITSDELGSALTASCYLELLTTIKEGIYKDIPYSARSGRASDQAIRKNLGLAGILKTSHKQPWAKDIDWARVDYLLTLRSRIKPDPLPPTLENTTPENPQVPNNSQMNP